MPSSTDEAFTQEENKAKEPSSLKQAISAKKSKKSKKTVKKTTEPDEAFALAQPPLATDPEPPFEPFQPSLRDLSPSPSPPIETAPDQQLYPPTSASLIIETQPTTSNQNGASVATDPIVDGEERNEGATLNNGHQDTILAPVALRTEVDSPLLPAAQASSGYSFPNKQLSPDQYSSFGRRLTEPGIHRISRPQDPPPPHMPQRHYAGPDDHYGLTNENDGLASTSEYFCGFDSLDEANGPTSNGAHNVVLIGTEGSLDIRRITRHQKDVIGCLEGLRGSVINAKILPWAGRDDMLHNSRPLVLCVVHGPLYEHPLDAGHHTDSPSASAPRMLDLNQVKAYRTTVEVYSLSTSRHLATLYEGPPIPLKYPPTHRLFKPPPPSGSLVISAKGRFMTVASGQSGEVYVFALSPSASHIEDPEFLCIGKFWTRVRKLPRSVGPLERRDEPGSDTTTERSSPMMALSKRWLAVSPPLLSSSQVSLDGSAIGSGQECKPWGVSAYVSPAPPAPDCEVDVALGESLINRVTKQATKELYKGAQWVGEQGMSVIKNYWTRPVSLDADINHQGSHKTSDEHKSAFPPTHGSQEPHSPTVEPSLVSLLDLHKLLDFIDGRVKNPSTPLATFSLADGCSYLSFAPDGLALLSTNQMGDVSNVWNLVHATDTRSAAALEATGGGFLPNATGLIRRLSCLKRASESTVVDVQWSSQGNRLCILTDHGTLHVHEIPRNDPLAATLQSPLSLPQTRSGLPSPSTSPQELPVGGWFTNVRSGWQNVQGKLGAVRPRSESDGVASSTLQTLGNASVAARYAGRRAVRNGFDIAVGSAHNLRNFKLNKIQLNIRPRAFQPPCFRWMSGKDEGLLALIRDSNVIMYEVRSVYHVQGRKTIVSLDASKKAGPDRKLDSINSSRSVPTVRGSLDPKGTSTACASEGVHGFWTLNGSARTRSSSRVTQKQYAAAVTQDKDTSPQYMPLHRYRQVSLFAYDDQQTKRLARALGSTYTDPWVFGLSVPTGKKVNCQRTGIDDEAARDMLDRGVEGIVGQMEDDFALDSNITVRKDGHAENETYRHDEDLLQM